MEQQGGDLTLWNVSSGPALLLPVRSMDDLAAGVPKPGPEGITPYLQQQQQMQFQGMRQGLGPRNFRK